MVKCTGQLSQCRLNYYDGDFLPSHACYSCISPSLISFLFAFRFPVIHFENFCLAVNRLGSRVMVTSVILTPAYYKSCVYSKILIVE